MSYARHDTHTRVAGMEKRKPLTALPASHRAKPPWLSPNASATMSQQRCCGSTGQPNCLQRSLKSCATAKNSTNEAASACRFSSGR